MLFLYLLLFVCYCLLLSLDQVCKISYDFSLWHAFHKRGVFIETTTLLFGVEVQSVYILPPRTPPPGGIYWVGLVYHDFSFYLCCFVNFQLEFISLGHISGHMNRQDCMLVFLSPKKRLDGIRPDRTWLIQVYFGLFSLEYFFSFILTSLLWGPDIHHLLRLTFNLPIHKLTTMIQIMQTLFIFFWQNMLICHLYPFIYLNSLFCFI